MSCPFLPKMAFNIMSLALIHLNKMAPLNLSLPTHLSKQLNHHTLLAVQIFVLYNKLPDFNSFKSFGCLCYPFLHPHNQAKLEFRSLPCIFMGYSSKHKVYVCFHMRTSRPYIARHVVFYESIYPYPSQVSSDEHYVHVLLLTFAHYLNIL
ncbi:hypothetical protein V2J09_000570 [Rumex salicifolius]